MSVSQQISRFTNRTIALKRGDSLSEKYKQLVTHCVKYGYKDEYQCLKEHYPASKYRASYRKGENRRMFGLGNEKRIVFLESGYTWGVPPVNQGSKFSASVTDEMWRSKLEEVIEKCRQHQKDET